MSSLRRFYNNNEKSIALKAQLTFPGVLSDMILVVNGVGSVTLSTHNVEPLYAINNGILNTGGLVRTRHRNTYYKTI